MHCGHCCFSCTSEGIDMSTQVFKKAVALANKYGDWIFLGGGEPTIHSKFKNFLGIAILENECDDMPVGLITNGSNEQLTLRLLKLSKAGIISCHVSVDDWHDEISPKVIQMATMYKAIRKTKYDNLSNSGRAKGFGKSHCCCDDLFIKPNGDIYPCGCSISKIGNILDKNLKINERYLSHECEKVIK